MWLCVHHRGLRSAAELTALEDLNLSDTGVTDAGMQALSCMKRLRALNLSYTGAR